MRSTAIFMLFILLWPLAGYSQIDPSSAVLLNGGSTSSPVRDGGLDTGRYTVRPREVIRRETTVRKTTTDVRVQKATESQTEAPVAPQLGTFDAVESGDEVEVEAPAKPVFDPRRYTLLELSLAPGYLYNESRSTFAPRNYFVNAPAMGINALVWTTPRFGIQANYLGTFNANAADSYDNTKNIGVAEQWFSIGFKGRAFFGEGPLAPALIYGLHYREYQFRVPSDSQIRNKLSTTGLILTLEGEVPTSSFGSWTLAGEVGPKLRHQETSNVTSFKTGDSVETVSVGVSLGARYRFDQAQSMFWRLSYGVERNLFSGQTSMNDPITGAPQTNVSVTNAVSLFQLGYSWGN